jgi:hypothetical protein
MQLAVDGLLKLPNQTALVTEMPSFEAGLIAFLLFFLLMGIMFYVLRTERGKRAPPSEPLGPSEMVRRENPLSNSDAPFLGIVTLVILELVLDALIVVSVLQGMGSTAVGTMLAVAVFVAAAILAVYSSTFMEEAFTRKPRLEVVAANLSEKIRESEEHD